MMKQGRNLGPQEKLKRLEGAEATADGTALCFDIVTADDSKRTFWTTTKEIMPFVRYLIDMAQFAVRVNGRLPAPPVQETVKLDPIDAVGLDIRRGRTDAEAMLTLHIGAFPMAFAIDAAAVKNLESAIKQLVVVKPSVQ